jgi:alanine dehydrogenase
MIIGVPKEVKVHEYRVGLTPASVRELHHHGHQIVVEKGAGIQIGFSDHDYTSAGAEILETAPQIFERSDMIVKVKEPQESEYKLIKEGQILFTFLHLAADLKQTEALAKSKCIGIAYETVQDAHGKLPLLAPMSEIAGRLSIQMGAAYLQKPAGSRGILLSGIPGVESAHVVVIGGGAAGANAARMALGLGARVTILDRSMPRLYELDLQFGSRVQTVYSTRDSIERSLLTADLVIGSVLIPGAAAPKIISQKLLTKMKSGAVFIDIAIDQGGCAETSRPTTHDNPVFVEEDVIHYCVTNIPSAAAHTATCALNNVTLGYVSELAEKGYRKALEENLSLRKGLNMCYGHLTNKIVAHDLSFPYTPIEDALKA